METMTSEQIAYWREVLYLEFGPSVMFLSDEQIQQFKDITKKDLSENMK